jgi:hypothetical protein
MPKNPKPEPDDKEQSERFIETARELEADKNAEHFERALGVVVPPKEIPKTDRNKSK